MEQRGIKLPQKEEEEKETKGKTEEEEEDDEDEDDKKATKKKTKTNKKDNIIIPAPAVERNPEEAPMPGAWSVVEEKSEASSEAEKAKQKRVITVVLGEDGIDRVDDTAGILNDKEEEEQGGEGDGNESDGNQKKKKTQSAPRFSASLFAFLLSVDLRAEVDAEVKVEEEEEEPAKPVVFAKRTPFKGNARARSKAPAGGDED